jgi:DNA invertase Pin-like site-specific DNA recombinase
MNHIYLRVSTDHQDAENQKTGILAYLTERGMSHVMLHTDTASGAVPWRERGLLALLDEVERGDSIVVAEVSRIGRSTVDVLDFFREALARGVGVIVTKSGLVVDDTLQAKITTTILALAAEIEREFLLARTAEGYARARAAGVRVGRPPGKTSPSKIAGKRTEIERLLSAGVGKSATARLLNVSRGTLQRFLDRKPSTTTEETP